MSEGRSSSGGVDRVTTILNLPGLPGGCPGSPGSPFPLG